MFRIYVGQVCFFFFALAHNGYVYETFGISKHVSVKLQVTLIRAEMFGNPLIAKCFIYDVMGRFFVIPYVDL